MPVAAAAASAAAAISTDAASPTAAAAIAAAGTAVSGSAGKRKFKIAATAAGRKRQIEAANQSKKPRLPP